MSRTPPAEIEGPGLPTGRCRLSAAGALLLSTCVAVGCQRPPSEAVPAAAPTSQPAAAAAPPTPKIHTNDTMCVEPETVAVVIDIGACTADLIGGELGEIIAKGGDAIDTVLDCVIVGNQLECALSGLGVIGVPFASCMSVLYVGTDYLAECITDWICSVNSNQTNPCAPPVEPLPSHGGEIWPGEDCTDVCSNQSGCQYCTTGYCGRDGKCHTQPTPPYFICTPNGSSQADCPPDYQCFPLPNGTGGSTYGCLPCSYDANHDCSTPLGTPPLPVVGAACTPRTTGPYAGVPYYGNCPEPTMCTPGANGTWTCQYPTSVSPPPPPPPPTQPSTPPYEFCECPLTNPPTDATGIYNACVSLCLPQPSSTYQLCRDNCVEACPVPTPTPTPSPSTTPMPSPSTTPMPSPSSTPMPSPSSTPMPSPSTTPMP